MAWTNVSINFNTDDPKIGDITAVWNGGLPDQFSFSACGNKSQLPAFVAAAKAAQADEQTRRDTLAPFQTQILLALNS